MTRTSLSPKFVTARSSAPSSLKSPLTIALGSLFFVLMLISLVDVLAGFSVSLRAASRDVNLR